MLSLTFLFNSRDKGKKRASNRLEEVTNDTPHDPNAAGPSSVTVKKGVFITRFNFTIVFEISTLGIVKRAETRQCPICSEHIPVRLLDAHCKLETQRTEEVIRAVGSLEVYGDSVDGYGPVHPMSVVSNLHPSYAELNSLEPGAPLLEPRKPSHNPARGPVPLTKIPPFERKR